MKPGEVYLIGTDYEGDKREAWYDNLEDACRFAEAFADNRDGFGWIAWEIWANDPDDNDAWKAVKTWERETALAQSQG